MKAIELNTSNTVYVLPIYNDEGKIISYVSDNRSYKLNDLNIIAAE